MIKRLCQILASVLAVFILASCAKPQPEPVEQIDLEGFETAAVSVGGAAYEDANAKSIALSEQNGDTTITLTFAAGSKMSGTSQESFAPSCPEFSISMLDDPQRLVIRFLSLMYSDFERSMDAVQSPLIDACFVTHYSGEHTVDVCVQLNEEVAYSVRENSDSLDITLRRTQSASAPTEEDTDDANVEDVLSQGKFYVVSNEYRDFCNGTVASSTDVYPVQAADGENLMLISGAFNTEADASGFLNRLLSNNTEAVASQWKIVTLAQDELPAYDDTLRIAAAMDERPIRIDGEETAPDMLIPDGLFLTVTPEKDGWIYTKRMVSGVADSEYTYDQIYFMSNSDESRLLLDTEFSTVESAKYSPDGRKLAVLDREEETTHLYIFDLDTKELISDLSQMGFGDMISAYTWDSLGSTLYSVSGVAEMNVHQYDFNVPNESKRHIVVDKNGSDEGHIAFSNGEVYFAHTTLEEGAAVYRIKPDGGVRKKFADGSAFAISDNSQYMAINASTGDTAIGDAAGGDTPVSSGSTNKFNLIDMTTYEVKLITDEFAVYDFIWSWDCTRVFYIENRLSGTGGEGATSDDALVDGETDPDDEQDETPSDTPEEPADPYPYTLWVYDVRTGQNRAIADLKSSAISVSNRANEVYLSYTDDATGGDVVRATYIIDVAG